MVELGRGGGGHAIGRYIINERTIRRERSGDNENLSCLCTNQGGERSKVQSRGVNCPRGHHQRTARFPGTRPTMLHHGHGHWSAL